VTTLLDDQGIVKFTAEGGGWLTLRRPEPALRGAAPSELLHRARTLPGHLRYVSEAEETFLLGEVRNVDGLPFGAARERLLQILDETVADEAPPDETIEAALDASGFAWTRRDASWAVVVRDRLAREVLVSPVCGGVRATAVLADWDDIASSCRDALAAFLVSAQAGLRCARCELDERRASIVALVATAGLEVDLTHALLGVAAGCDLLAREAASLLRPEVAEIYRTCRRMPSKGPAPTRSDIPAATGHGKFHDSSDTEGR